MRVDGREVRLAGERLAAGQALEGDTGERVLIRPAVGGIALDLLRRDVADGAGDDAGLQRHRQRGAAAREPEVGQLRAVAVDEDVGGLDVTVDEARDVGGVERIGDRRQQAQRGRVVRRIRRQALLERPAGDVAHRQVDVAVVLARRVDRDDRRMLEARCEPRLLQQRRVGRSEEFHRQLAIERLVAGQEHHPHATGAELAQDHEPADPIAGAGMCHGATIQSLRARWLAGGRLRWSRRGPSGRPAARSGLPRGRMIRAQWRWYRRAIQRQEVRQVGSEPTVVFFPEGAYGPTNNCVGIGQVLRARGVRVVFVIEESFAGSLEARGFEERLMRLGPPPETEEAPGQFWKDFIAATAPEFRKPTIEQLETFIAPTMGALVDGARYVDDRLREIIDELQPDLVVEDNVCSFPALLTHAKRWARIASCNPAELLDPQVPPVFSGYAAGDQAGWAEFWDGVRHAPGPLWDGFDEFCRERGAPGLAAAHVHPRVGHAEPLPLPGRGRLPARAPARPGLAPDRHLRARRGGRGGAAGRDPSRRRLADLPLARLAGIGRRRPDAAAV